MSVATRLDVWHGLSAPADWNRMSYKSRLSALLRIRACRIVAGLGSAPGNNAVIYDSVRQPHLSDTEG